jgi:Flp pilus assembly protein TadG
MHNVWSDRGSKFIDSTQGNVSVISSLGIIGLLLAVGSAIDFANVVDTNTALSSAVDAAALQASATGSSDTDTLDDRATASLGFNYNEAKYGELISRDLAVSGDILTLTATARYHTAFLRVFGIDHVDVPVTSAVMKGGVNIELALVLDTTSSMSSRDMVSLKTAAKSLAETVINGDQSGYSTRVAVIPYSYGVNLGTMVSDARGTTTSGTCSSTGCDYYSFTNSSGSAATYGITNCATERTGSDAYTDANVKTSPVGSLYAPNSWYCRSSNEILPLTSDIGTIEDRIDALEQGGATAGQVGVAWGWYTVSPNIGMWTGDQAPAAYGTENTEKIVVIMTDGEFNISYCNGVMSKNYYQGSDRINCNATNGSPTSQAKSLCTAMKAEGITVYTVGYNISNTTTAKSLLSDCASDSAKYYLSSSTAELEAAFSSIADEIVSLRLSK